MHPTPKSMLKNIYLFVICLFAGFQFACAQPSIFKLSANTSAARQTNSAGASVTIISPTEAGVKLHQQQLLQRDAKQWLASQLEMRQGVDGFAEEGGVTKAAAALEVTKLYQYYKGIKVEHGVVNTTSLGGKVVLMQMEFYSIPDKFTIVPARTSAAAFKIAAASMHVPDSLLMQYGRVPGLPSPAGELVIVRTYDDDSTVCLAWKFEIQNYMPYAIANVYVNAQTGKVVLRDDLLKDADVPGTAKTRYSGTQTIVTDNGGTDPAKPYRLRQHRNGHDIITLNLQGGLDITKSVDFVDDDNNWLASEHRNAKQDDVALDVHFNMQVISDYLKIVLQRNSWDNAFAPFTSYVHVPMRDRNPPNNLIPMNNAGWAKSYMIYGDGTYPSGTGEKDFRPLTSLDVSAHEIGHAVTQTTSKLVYERESGALNEGFSDIWGALIEKWGIDQNPSITPGKEVWKIGEEITSVIGDGLRNMKDPRSKGNPSTYKDDMWKPADASCDPYLTQDRCGVHSNSGVLNKWAYLITVGEASNNSLNQLYNVKGIGFEKMAELAYLTVNNLTPNAGYNTCKAVSMEAAAVLWGAASPEVQTVRSAWNAVGVDSAIWVMDNTPVFAANSNQSFTSVGIARNGDIWAGTNRKGLYVFNGTNWTRRTEIPNVIINDIRPDGKGGMFVAQSGTGTGTAAQGGVNYFADPGGPMTKFYTVSTNIDVPTRNVRGIYVDSSHLNSEMNPSVWIATNTYINSSGNSASGKPAWGLNNSSPAFSPINEGIEISNRINGVTAIGGGDNKVWTFSALNYGKNQILSYDATTGALLAVYDHSANPEIPLNFSVKAIYTDKWTGSTWFGLNTNAVLVVDARKNWYYVSFSSIFPPGSQVNNNAITGSRIGDIYIGTTAGLVFFEQYSRPGRFLDSLLYRRYGKPNGLPSDNITGLAYDRNNWKIWVATDKGMCLWDPLCIEACDGGQAFAVPLASVKSGNWSDTSVWENKKIPDSNSVLKIDKEIIVDINAECKYILINNNGSLKVNTGKQLKVYGNKDAIILDGQRQLKK